MTRSGVLTASLIVRDEVEALPRCLDTLRSSLAVGEVCVLDTGSCDGTAEFARRAGCRVEEWAWRDDFAAARNRALEMVRTPWALVIDADEEWYADTATLLPVLSASRGVDALVIDVDDVRDGHLVSRSPSVRLLRVGVAGYRNRVHEVVTRVDGGALTAVAVSAATARLVHTGYDVAYRDERRHARNLALAEQQVEDCLQAGDPEGLVAALVNRGRARSAFDGASAAPGLTDFLEAWGMPVGGSFRHWAGELAVSALADAGRGAEAGPILAALPTAGSNPAQLAWLAAKAFGSLGRTPEKLVALRRAEGRVTAMGSGCPTKWCWPFA